MRVASLACTVSSMIYIQAARQSGLMTISLQIELGQQSDLYKAVPVLALTSISDQRQLSDLFYCGSPR